MSGIGSGLGKRSEAAGAVGGLGGVGVVSGRVNKFVGFCLQTGSCRLRPPAERQTLGQPANLHRWDGGR
jgi:hypothetical protein